MDRARLFKVKQRGVDGLKQYTPDARLLPDTLAPSQHLTSVARLRVPGR